MHIAVEGLDGVGKTSVAAMLAERLDFTFIEKPLHFLTDTDGLENYLRITRKINDSFPPAFTAQFYGLGNLYLRLAEKGRNIVTDRDLCSTWFWNANQETLPYFDYLVEQCGLPDRIVVLYADQKERYKRILNRNPNDPDLQSKVMSNESYDKIKEFIKRYHARYFWIDSSDLTCEETVNTICRKLEEEGLIHG